jgi:hypothetical protein
MNRATEIVETIHSPKLLDLRSSNHYIQEGRDIVATFFIYNHQPYITTLIACLDR